MFKIPIEQYEKDINSTISEEKKEEILNHLTNSHKLRNKEEFDEIKDKLHEPFKRGDFELIKIYLNETIHNESNDLVFKIDESTKTAFLFKVSSNTSQLNVPRTVHHESNEYLITSIAGTHSSIQTIKFSEDSAVKTIHFGAFSNSKIEEICFPSSLSELKDGWCFGANNLVKITISPSNGQFIFKDDQYLVGKTDPKSDEFDNFIFARRDIKEICIPTNIKNISSYAFDCCVKLTKVEIEPNSKLQIIGSHAFSSSRIGKICIPHNVSQIGEYAFHCCRDLTKVEIPPNSNLQTIGSHAFSTPSFKEIYIPSKVSIIGKSAFYNCRNLSKVEIDPNSNLQTIESNAFAYSNIEEIFIPPKVSTISENTFLHCYNLAKVIIPPNSNLKIIESNAFSGSKIEEINLPASLKELKEGWCFMTKNLTKISISPSNDQFIFKDDKYIIGKTDPNSDEFNNLLFARRDIKEVSIPTNIKIISSYAFDNCVNLTKVEIEPNSNLQTIEPHAFSSSGIDKIYIPSNVSQICEYAFSSCSNLTEIEIPANSNLQTIKSFAFAYSKIEKIFIPPNVSKICKHVFAGCQSLAKVDIPQNSNLQTIESNAFSGSKIEEIYFPSSLRELQEGWCYGANKLAKIIVSPSNDQFIFVDDQYLVGKTDPKSDEFDNFIFARRDIKEICIPTNIKTISSYAFHLCRNLTKVEIPPNSNLEAIESNAFSSSKINEVYIPSKVSKISENAFYCCSNLKIVEISEESKLSSFPFSAFYGCSSRIIYMIPSSLKLQILKNEPIDD